MFVVISTARKSKFKSEALSTPPDNGGDGRRLGHAGYWMKRNRLEKIAQPGEFNDVLSRQNSGD
jgi:hypothetical protein